MKYLLIGHAIQNSLSPSIHRAIFKRLGSEDTYDLCPVEVLAEELDRFMNKEVAGFNVTIPFKQQIIPFLDGLDASAIYAGAVNTVKRQQGAWIGYNTDGLGFLKSIETYIEESHKILLMGTGGAAYGIASTLLANGYGQLTIAGRQNASLSTICEHLREQFQVDAQGIAYDQIDASAYQVIINATSVGMIGADQEPLFDYDTLNASHVVADVVYKPHMTPLLKKASEKNAVCVGGLDMLLAQALYAESIWQNQSLEWTDYQSYLQKTVRIFI